MKKSIYSFTFSAMLAGVIFTSCQSKQEKVEEKKEEVTEAKEELKEAQKELNSEYPAYKTRMEERIAANEKEIARLQEIINKPGKKPLDEARKDRIAFNPLAPQGRTGIKRDEQKSAAAI